MSSTPASVPDVPDDLAVDAVADWVVFDGTITIDYGQFYFQSSDYDGEDAFEDAFVGQSNGLCGAAKDSRLVFVTGPNVGDPPLRVERHTSEPVVDDRWEDIVEASLTLPRPTTYHVVEWMGERVGRPVPLVAGSYRFRYNASGMDEAIPGITDDADRYLVQFWPAPAAPDRVVTEGSRSAAYWRTYFSGS